MIASFTDHARKKEGKKDYDKLVGFYCKNITQTSTWMLILSISNNIQQKTFSNQDAKEMAKILCSEFGVRASGIQYFKTFSSAPSLQEATKVSNVIKLTIKKVCHKTNNERLIYELRSAIQDKTIEYRQALELAIKIMENYPDTEKLLQG
jgi:hypothetical protein